ncbi:MAG: hypothetical protein AAB686_03740 [Patescibacteria group bacterium]
MDELTQKIDALEKKIDSIQHSIDTVKRIFFWIIIISVAMVVLPLIGLAFIIPSFLSSYNSILGL